MFLPLISAYRQCGARTGLLQSARSPVVTPATRGEKNDTTKNFELCRRLDGDQRCTCRGNDGCPTGLCQRGSRIPMQLETLRGTYIFNASGHINLQTGWTPKAVVEFLTFNGDGTLTSVGTASIGGNIAGGSFHQTTGGYSLKEDCTGTLAFNPQGPHFDIFVVPGGAQIHMIQTDSSNVLAGVVKRISR
jgi:hypothetical protein